jgi:hypothetical protein
VKPFPEVSNVTIVLPPPASKKISSISTPSGEMKLSEYSFASTRVNPEIMSFSRNIGFGILTITCPRHSDARHFSGASVSDSAVAIIAAASMIIVIVFFMVFYLNRNALTVFDDRRTQSRVPDSLRAAIPWRVQV